MESTKGVWVDTHHLNPTLLEYFGYASQVWDLLTLLSRRTREACLEQDFMHFGNFIKQEYACTVGYQDEISDLGNKGRLGQVRLVVEIEDWEVGAFGSFIEMFTGYEFLNLKIKQKSQDTSQDIANLFEKIASNQQKEGQNDFEKYEFCELKVSPDFNKSDVFKLLPCINSNVSGAECPETINTCNSLQLIYCLSSTNILSEINIPVRKLRISCKPDHYTSPSKLKLSPVFVKSIERVYFEDGIHEEEYQSESQAVMNVFPNLKEIELFMTTSIEVGWPQLCSILKSEIKLIASWYPPHKEPIEESAVLHENDHKAIFVQDKGVYYRIYCWEYTLGLLDCCYDIQNGILYTGVEGINGLSIDEASVFIEEKRPYLNFPESDSLQFAFELDNASRITFREMYSYQTLPTLFVDDIEVKLKYKFNYERAIEYIRKVPEKSKLTLLILKNDEQEHDLISQAIKEACMKNLVNMRIKQPLKDKVGVEILSQALKSPSLKLMTIYFSEEPVKFMTHLAEHPFEFKMHIYCRENNLESEEAKECMSKLKPSLECKQVCIFRKPIAYFADY